MNRLAPYAGADCLQPETLDLEASRRACITYRYERAAGRTLVGKGYARAATGGFPYFRQECSQ